MLCEAMSRLVFHRGAGLRIAAKPFQRLEFVVRDASIKVSCNQEDFPALQKEVGRSLHCLPCCACSSCTPCCVCAPCTARVRCSSRHVRRLRPNHNLPVVSPLSSTSHWQMDNYFLRILDSAQYKDLKATRDQITRWGLFSRGCLYQ